MEDYIVSARKYRPTTFESVVGQGAIASTLKNAIMQGKLANTYLFCGPRGVGKTTCARIFAKTINCQYPGPDGEACGQCESCLSFNEELRSYNVFELDAASNNSVDDIRNLTDQVRIPPMNGKYKVYIIDEVHMLSQQAFNAFLKTLEEPPRYAIFILATTEKHKIIPTILSRCQIYDFGRISNAQIVGHLKNVAAKEGITTDDRALDLIARKSDGGMRDALSTFDQVASYTGGNVTYEKTAESLGVIDTDCYFRLTDMLLEKKVPDSLLLLDGIMAKGFDPSHLIGGLMLHLRNLLVSRDACTLPLLDTSDEMRQRYQAQAAKCSPKFLYRALKICNDCDLNYRASKNKRLLVELTLIRASQADDDDDSSGRKPKRLKPIFALLKTLPVQDRTAVQTAASAATPGKTQTPQPQVGAVQPHIQTAGAAGLQQPESTKKQPLPSFKAGMFASIFQNSETAGRAQHEERQQAQTGAVATAQSSGRNLTQELLDNWWTAFASDLERIDTPLKNRMSNCRPELTSGTTFMVKAGNPMMAQELEAAKTRIQEYIGRALSNPAISMEITVDTERHMEHILTRDQQYEKMKESCPALAELDSVFNLELR